MKYLLIFLTIVVLVAGFLQLQAWKHRCALNAEQVVEVDGKCADKVRAMKMGRTNPDEQMYLENEIERLRRQSESFNQQLITELRTKPFGIPLSPDEKAALDKAVAGLRTIEQDRLGDTAQRDRSYQERERDRLAAEEKARRRPYTAPGATPKPGDWMWKDRPVTQMDKSYGRQ